MDVSIVFRECLEHVTDVLIVILTCIDGSHAFTCEFARPVTRHRLHLTIHTHEMSIGHKTDADQRVVKRLFVNGAERDLSEIVTGLGS